MTSPGSIRPQVTVVVNASPAMDRAALWEALTVLSKVAKRHGLDDAAAVIYYASAARWGERVTLSHESSLRTLADVCPYELGQRPLLRTGLALALDTTIGISPANRLVILLDNFNAADAEQALQTFVIGGGLFEAPTTQTLFLGLGVTTRPERQAAVAQLFELSDRALFVDLAGAYSEPLEAAFAKQIGPWMRRLTTPAYGLS